MTIHLLASKTDPFRHEIDVRIANSMAIVAMIDYLAARPSPLSPTSPLFIFSDRKILTRAALIKATRALVTKFGVDMSKFRGISFRRGGATSLALIGVPDRLIKIMGRWKGWSYSLYIETPIIHLIHAGQRM
jgi:hypothetical protein